MQGNLVRRQLIVGKGANLVQRNLWVDNCLQPGIPWNCFATPTGGWLAGGDLKRGPGG